jgi:exodeoxyribonuclease-3
MLNKGGWDWLRDQDADVICLQEIKARPEQLTEDQHHSFDGYQAFWNPAKQPGYSGVLTLARSQPDECDYGVTVEEFDVEGRVVRTRHPGFHLYNIYFPNGQRGQGRVDYKLAFYARLLELCDQIHARGEQVILCGDFNTAHQEIDLKNPRQNIKTSGFLPEERAWLDIYMQHGLVDAYRQLYPQRVQYTWWTYRMNARQRGIGWRLDFYMVSTALADKIKDVEVHEAVMGSDHCPVSLLIED